MKKTVALLLLLAFGLCLPAVNHAMIFKSGERIIVERKDINTQDLYMAGELINFYGSALQDVWAVARTAFFWGVVGQDLNLLVSDGEIKGKVGDDLRVVGNKVMMAGKVSGSLLFIGNELTVHRNATVGSDAFILANSTVIDGVIQGPVTINSQKVVINGTVMSDVTIKTKSLVLGPNAGIYGHLTYSTPERLGPELKRQVKGTITWKESLPPAPSQNWLFNLGHWWFMITLVYKFTLFLALLAVGILMIALWPKACWRYTDLINTKPLPSLGWGLALVLGLPVLILILVITIIGIPLALVLVFFYIVLLVFAKLGLALWLGQKVFNVTDQAKPLQFMLGMAIGLAFLGLIDLIPLFRNLVNLVVMIFGSGALWLMIIERPGTALPGIAGQPVTGRRHVPAVKKDSSAPVELALETGAQEEAESHIEEKAAARGRSKKSTRTVKKATRKKQVRQRPATGAAKKATKAAVPKTVKKTTKKRVKKASL